MNGVQGPYAKARAGVGNMPPPRAWHTSLARMWVWQAIFVDEFGAPPESCINAVPKVSRSTLCPSTFAIASTRHP